MIEKEWILTILYAFLLVAVVKFILIKIIRKLGKLFQLKTKTIGNITGISTSIPELLTVSFSASSGLMETSIYNVISSNVINVLQYLFSLVIHKNGKILKEKEIQLNLYLILITIFLPILLRFFSVDTNLYLVPVFIFFTFFFYFLNYKIHEKYNENAYKEEIDETDIQENKRKKKMGALLGYIILLLFVSLLLFVIGEALSNSLEVLCERYQVPEWIVGILLGFITSIPELVTFFESQNYHKKKEEKREGMIEATNNLLTSNILNLFIIQSVGILFFHFLG